MIRNLLICALITLTACEEMKNCSQVVTVKKSVTVYQKQGYYSYYYRKCGFLWLSRCTKSRYRYKKVSLAKYYNVKETQCCSGWYGASCQIHSSAPTVTYCPPNFQVCVTSDEVNQPLPVAHFEEPFGFALNITSVMNTTSTFEGLGNVTVTYTAVSANNGLQSKCQYTVRVNPPVDKVEIVGQTDGATLKVEVGDALTFQCRALYGRPGFTLSWWIDGQQLIDANFTVNASGLEDYTHSESSVLVRPDRNQDGSSITCRGEKIGRATEEITMLLNNPDPVLICPADVIHLAIDQHEDIVALGKPLASDVNNDPLSITCTEWETGRFRVGQIHQVTCTAVNTRTSRNATCHYNVTVACASCPWLNPPKDAALVCAYWHDSNTTVCQPVCQMGKDIPDDTLAPFLSRCTDEGTWQPALHMQACNERRGRRSMNMPSSYHYLRGPCEQLSTKDLALEALMEVIALSSHHGLCPWGERCVPDDFKLFCVGY